MFKKYISKLFLVAALMLFTIILSEKPTKCFGAYLDDDGYLCIETVDKKKSSEIWYKTHGLSISRCKYNPSEPELMNGAATEYYYDPNILYYSPPETYGGGDTVAYNTFRTPLSTLLSSRSAAWQAEVRNALDGTGPMVWIRLDCIMFVYHGTQRLSHPYINIPPVDGLNPAEIMAAEGWANPAGLVTHFNQYIPIGVKRGIEPQVLAGNAAFNEFDNLELTDYTHSSDPDGGSHDHGVPSTTNNYKNPYYAEGNFSDKYDLGEGIPVDEEVLNKYRADEWYGATDVRSRVVTTSQYDNIVKDYSYQYWDSTTYNIRYQNIKNEYWYSYDKYIDTDNDGIDDFYVGKVNVYHDVDYGEAFTVGPTSSIHSPAYIIEKWPYITTEHFKMNFSDETDPWGWNDTLGNLTTTPVVAYQYLANTQIYDFMTLSVWNRVYPGCLSYSSKKHLKSEVISTSNYFNISDSNNVFTLNAFDWYNNPLGSQAVNTIWSADDGKHVEWAEVNMGRYRTTIDVRNTANMHYHAKSGWYYTNKDLVRDKDIKPLFLSDKKSLLSEIRNTITRNDKLFVDNNMCMSNEDAVGAHILSATNNDIIENYKGAGKYRGLIESSAVKNGYGTKGKTLNTCVIGIEEEEQTIVIPQSVDNGDYETGIKAQYMRMVKCDTYKDNYQACIPGADQDYGFGGDLVGGGHCLDTHARKGWIFVHAPIISPFKILTSIGEEAAEQTQLVQTVINPDAVQLLLDSNYVIDWYQLSHRTDTPGYGSSATGHKDGGDDVTHVGETPEEDDWHSRYDKYVEAKYVKFPFTVFYGGKEYPANTWIKTNRPDSYEQNSNFATAKASNGYVPQSQNHWRKTIFYIPSYAIEGGEVGNEMVIETMVEAVNVDGMYAGDHNEETYWPIKELGSNPDGWANMWESDANKQTAAHDTDIGQGARYVAYSKLKVQLSGQIYDFTITGTSDKETFLYEDTGTQISTDVVPFCVYKMEKKSGIYNRFGGTGVRYRADGEVNNAWPWKNTIALIPGKSNSMNDEGYVTKGTNFAFSFKTIANLGDDDDRITITPSFKYVRDDGSKTDNLKVYYYNPVTDEKFIEYGSARDIATSNQQPMKLIDKQFDMSYYTDRNTTPSGPKFQIGDWINYTSTKFNQGSMICSKCSYTGVYLRICPKCGSSAVSQSIRPTSQVQSPEEWMNHESRNYCLSKIILDNRTRFLSGEWEQLEVNTRGTSRMYSALSTYMTEISNWNSDSLDKFRVSMQTWYGKYFIPANLYIVDLDDPATRSEITAAGCDPDNFNLKDYANNKGGINQEDKIFITDKGYTIINFNIQTYNHGSSHLNYAGGNVGGKNMWQMEGYSHSAGPDLPLLSLEDGDVVVIDMKKSITDMYSAGLFNIN